MNTMLRRESRNEEVARTSYRSGWSLPAYHYLSSECHEHDVAVMRECSWFIAGHESQIPRAGDYKLFPFAQDSIILMREKTGTVNAFYNVCRHRGSQICREAQGNVKLLTCPYHAWTYRLDGTLLPPRGMPEGFNPQDYGLKRCHVRTADGIIFICLAAGTPPDFEEFMSRLRPFLRPYALNRTKVVSAEQFLTASSWKVGVENFQECYHCGNAHQDMMRILPVYPPTVETFVPDEKGEIWSARMQRLGRRLEPLYDVPSSQHLQSAIQMEIGCGNLSGTSDGKPRSKLLGDMTEWSGGWTLLSFNPFCHALLFDDYLQLLTYAPVEVGKTAATLLYLVRDDAVEGVDYDVPALTELMNHVMKEDEQITDDNQRGILSSAYSPSPLSTEEAGLVRFHSWYFHHFGDAASKGSRHQHGSGS